MQGTPLEICIVPIPEDCVVLPLSPIHPVNNTKDKTEDVNPAVFKNLFISILSFILCV